MIIRETAYAKVNLALHVRQRREEDGYHELETLFAFIDAGDRLTARSSARDELQIVGEFASQIADPFGNLVSKALAKLPRPDGLSVTLEKNLPVAAGLGGGSADAGAVFRLVREAHGLPDDWHARAAALGADVPACVESLACIGRGTGTELVAVENDMSGVPVLLVNPRIPLSTPEIFARWDRVDRGPLPEGPASAIAREGRNDLEAPATALCESVRRLLDDLAGREATLARMSGSGATCFALYADEERRDRAAAAIAGLHPTYWTMTGNLR